MNLHLPATMTPSKLAEYLPHKVRGSFEGKNVSTAERLVSGALGLWVLTAAMKRGMLGRALMIPLGLAALKRAATGTCDIYKAAGLSSAEEEGSVKESSLRGLKQSFDEKSPDRSAGEQVYVQ